MSKRVINIGNAPNDGTGDPLRTGLSKVNENFTELYNTLGDGNNVISYASTAGISTLAGNLTGTPSIEVSGLSENGMFFMFEHNFYNHKGEHLAHCEMQGAWINLKTRKLCDLPEDLLQLADQFPKSENFKTLTKEDTRKHNVRPKNLVI